VSQNQKSKKSAGKTAALSLGALGVVYGDIGTSPIYAFNESVHAGGSSPSSILGVLSLVFWTLMLVVSVKYLLLVLRADNRGEGGVLALLALMPTKIRNATKGGYGFMVFCLLMAAAFIFADGLLTPAISVLSAAEGLKSIDPSWGLYAVPVTVIILAILFTFQFKGTQLIGNIFGPVMVVWFLTIGGLGLFHLSQNLNALQALNPMLAIDFIGANQWHTLFVMSSVILAVTGAEALYADLGHFGKTPIRIGWFGLVGISLVLNYFGQGALMLRDPSMVGNSFFGMVTGQVPSILLFAITTIATVIASQALISGVASIASQAIQLGLLPRLKVNHTNEGHRGQIYVPLVNALMAAGSISLVLIFETSAALAGAYTFAIAGTMLVTTVGMYFVARERWGLSKFVIIPVFSIFGLMDLVFVISTSTKVVTGAWLPMLIGFCLGSMMWIWRKGRRVLNYRLMDEDMTIQQIERMRAKGTKVAVSKGTGIYLSAVKSAVPQALQQQIRVLHSMPEKIIFVSVETIDDPFSHEPPKYEQINEFMGRVTLKAGFMEARNLPRALKSKTVANYFDEKEAIYYVTERTLVQSHKGDLNRIEEIVFETLHRNASTASRYFKLPAHRVITFNVSVEI
jgi:KUP system potassium uptake protein